MDGSGPSASSAASDTAPDTTPGAATPAAAAAASGGAPDPARSSGRPAMVALDGVSLTLATSAGAVNILSGIDLKIGAGERVGLVGASGSGKTSLLMTIAGLERPTAGRITVAGTALDGLDEDGRARFRGRTIGIVFQAFHLIPTMTALENVAVPLEFARVRDAARRAAEGLDAVGLGHRRGHYPSQLSGGEQQRVAIARALAVAPRLILADEPTGNLDADTGARVMALLFGAAAERGTTLMLVTHDPALAARCDRVVRLADGRIVDPGTERAGGAE